MQRHNISEFGNVNLTCVVRDLIQINNFQRQMQDKKGQEAKKNDVINRTVEPNRTKERADDVSKNPSEQPPPIEERVSSAAVSSSEETPMENESQVSQEHSEQNDSCHQNNIVKQIDSHLAECPTVKKTVEQTPPNIMSTQSVPFPSEADSISPCVKLEHSRPIITSHEKSLTPPQTNSSTSQNLEIPFLKSEITKSCSEESFRSSSETRAAAEISKTWPQTASSSFETPRAISETPEQNSETIRPSTQISKPNFELHRPYFDNPKPFSNITSPSSDAPIPNSRMLHSTSLSRPSSSTTPQQNVMNPMPSRPGSVTSQSSSTPLLSQLNSSVSDQKEFDIFSPQFDQSNNQADNSSNELKNLDSEISQIIDQLGNDLAKEGNIFSQTSNQPAQESQNVNYPSQISQRTFQSLPVGHHSQTDQFPEMVHHLKHPSQMSNQHFPQIGHHQTQQPIRMGQASTEMRQFLPQMASNSSHLAQNHPHMGHYASQMTTNPTQMGPNRSEMGQNSQHMPHAGQHQSQIGQHSYQMRQYLSQIGHSSQRAHPEISYHPQMGRHPPQGGQPYSQLSSQFPNISNHLRNGPQMGYVSSNMANALAQMGQVPSEYNNQMTPQMRYLRMQLQMRHRSSPLGPLPTQLGHRPQQMEGWPPQVRHWASSVDHDSSQRNFNSGTGQMSDDQPQYRPSQLNHPPHMGYGSSQTGQGSSAFGQLPHHMKQSLPQANQVNSQYSYPQTGQPPLHFTQMQHYLNRGQPHFNRASPSQSPGLSEMHQRSLQQTPTPPSRSPLETLPPQGRSVIFSPPNFEGYPSSERGNSNGDMKKSDSPLTNCKSPEVSGRYGERDHWRMSPFNFRTSNSPVPRFVPPQINPQIRMPSQHVGTAPPHFGLNSEHIVMPPPQTSFLPKDHLAQRLRLNSGTLRPENPQFDNYHSASDENINNLLVGLPPIESPVVPLSVQIKPLGTLESIQQPVKESRETSEVLSSVKESSDYQNSGALKNTEVQNGSGSVGMKEGASVHLKSKFNFINHINYIRSN